MEVDNKNIVEEQGEWQENKNLEKIVVDSNQTHNSKDLLFHKRKAAKITNYNTDRVASVENLRSNKKYSKAPIYQEEDVKELKIVDYFNGLNRLNRYIRKTKERLSSATKGFFKSENIRSKIFSPFKRTLLNVNEIYRFVEDHQQKLDEMESKENENNENIVQINQSEIVVKDMSEKEKWSKIMD